MRLSRAVDGLCVSRLQSLTSTVACRTRLVERSHLTGVNPADVRPEDESRLICSPGTVLIYDGGIIHGGGGAFHGYPSVGRDRANLLTDQSAASGSDAAPSPDVAAANCCCTVTVAAVALAAENSSTETRYAIQGFFCRSSRRPFCDHTRSIPPDIVASETALMRRLWGFESQVMWEGAPRQYKLVEVDGARPIFDYMRVPAREAKI